jgi:hypothetical protein
MTRQRPRPIHVMARTDDGRRLLILLLELIGGIEIVEVDDATRITRLRGHEPLCAICVESPAGRPAEGEAWLAFLDDALERTAAAQRVLVSHDDVLDDTAAQVLRLAAFAGRPQRNVDAALIARAWRVARESRTTDHPVEPPFAVQAVHALARCADTRDKQETVARLVRLARASDDEDRVPVAEPVWSRADLAVQSRRLRAEHRRLEREVALLQEAISSIRAVAPSTAPSPSGRPGSAAAKRIEYERLIDRLRRVVESSTPVGSTVAVVSRGDPQLLLLDGRSGWHFPQVEGGGYAGHHPADAADAIGRLEQVRARGAGYLVFPATARWWLDHYGELRRHLEAQHELVADDPETCTIYRLREPSPATALRVIPREGNRTARQAGELAARLLPEGAVVAVVTDTEQPHVPFEGLDAFALPMCAAATDKEEPQAVIDALEAARARGAGYLVVPSGCMQLVDRRRELVQHLASRYRLVTRQRRMCTIYDLSEPDRIVTQKQRRHNRRRSVVG